MDALGIAAIGMQADLARMESISQNAANALTPGYKRQVAVTSAFAVEMAAVANSRHMSLSAPVTVANSTALDTSIGAMRPTANPQDVAIEGTAFFEVATPTGPGFTKLGNLHADAQGRLVTGQNLPVMGAGGEIRVTNAPFSVSPKGEVTQEGRVVGQLKLVTFLKPQSLVPNGGGVYLATGEQPQDARGTASLRAGFLEGSNVSTPQEMVRLTETVRHFESLTKIVQGYDESLEKTIRKLGEY